MIVPAGEPATEGLILLQGIACQQSCAGDGAGPITAINLPGDFLNLDAVLLTPNRHEVVAVDHCRVGVAALPSISNILLQDGASLGRLLLSRDHSIQREWLVSLGSRPALARMAHLFCELWARNEACGLIQANGFDFPLRQIDVGYAIGLSAVHVNRTAQELRHRKLLAWRDRKIVIHDPEALRDVAGFNPDYLGLT